MFMMFLWFSNGLFSSLVSCWAPVRLRVTPYCEEWSQCFFDPSEFPLPLVSVIIGFNGRRLSALSPTTNLGSILWNFFKCNHCFRVCKQQLHLWMALVNALWKWALENRASTRTLVSTLRPFRHELLYRESKTPADIALWVLEACKGGGLFGRLKKNLARLFWWYAVSFVHI